jgi:hypothetical protein
MDNIPSFMMPGISLVVLDCSSPVPINNTISQPVFFSSTYYYSYTTWYDIFYIPSSKFLESLPMSFARYAGIAEPKKGIHICKTSVTN